jgi:hypothetical protein
VLEEIRSSKQLLVEGKDGRSFFRAMFRHMELKNVQVHDFGGNQQFKSFLKAFVRAPGFLTLVEKLAIIRDAEDNPGDAFESIRGDLRTTELEAPEKPELFTGSVPSVGILILPNSGTAGMLETLCLDSVAEDPAMRCIKEYFSCLANEPLVRPRNPTKAMTQSFLASREFCLPHVGLAAEEGYWPWNNPSFDHVKAFLENLRE